MGVLDHIYPQSKDNELNSSETDELEDKDRWPEHRDADGSELEQHHYAISEPENSDEKDSEAERYSEQYDYGDSEAEHHSDENSGVERYDDDDDDDDDIDDCDDDDHDNKDISTENFEHRLETASGVAEQPEQKEPTATHLSVAPAELKNIGQELRNRISLRWGGEQTGLVISAHLYPFSHQRVSTETTRMSWIDPCVVLSSPSYTLPLPFPMTKVRILKSWNANTMR